MRDALIGVDIGTSSTKAILFDLNGTEVASASRVYSLSTPQPGWVEQDPEAVWQALVAVLREVAEQAQDYSVIALALAAQGGSIIPADASGDPVYPMITWLDSRSAALVRQWEADGTAEQIKCLSGWHPFAGLPLPSIAWLREYRPDVHAAAARYLGPADFLIHRLTGRFATDLSAAAEMLLVDVRTGRWSDALCAIGGVRPEMQSELGWAGRIIGPITEGIATLTDLPLGTLVVAGGMDQVCACAAMGNIVPGRFMLSTGTAWTITGTVESPSQDTIPSGLNVSFHVATGRWTITQYVGGYGATMEWWLQQAWRPADPAQLIELKELYRHLDEALLSSAPGSHGLLFLPLGSLPQPEKTDGFAGGVFLDLDLVHTRADMTRAIMEGCGYEVRWFLEDLRSAGTSVEELWVSGGATASPVWPQILADISRTPIVLASYANWAALGSAILAGLGVGAFQSLAEGVARLQPPVSRIAPNLTYTDLYASRFAEYRRAIGAFTGAKHRLLAA